MSVYVQRQIDRLFRVYRKFVKTYVDDIVIFSRIWQKHVNHLRQIFIKLINVNIFIKFIKTFIDYSSMQLLNQKIDSFDLFINEKKLKIIVKFQFFRTFRQLKICFDFIDWMRKYVSFYVDVWKSLQKKIILLKSVLKKTLKKFSLIELESTMQRQKNEFHTKYFNFYFRNFFISFIMIRNVKFMWIWMSTKSLTSTLSFIMLKKILSSQTNIQSNRLFNQ